MDSVLKAIVAGALFGTWPLFLNKGGLNGILSTLILLLFTLLFVAPFAVKSISANSQNFSQVSWTMVLLAGLASAGGLMAFNSMFMKATPETMGTLFVIVVLAQVSIPIVYGLVMGGGMTITKATGFAFAIAGAVLLSRS